VLRWDLVAAVKSSCSTLGTFNEIKRMRREGYQLKIITVLGFTAKMISISYRQK
jgi:hypothetical protein